MKLFINVNQLPRPERSGVISILVMYLSLVGYGDIINAPYARAAEHWVDLLCWVFPCSVFARSPERTYPKEPERRVRYTPLVFGTGSPGKPICACHFDMHFWGKPVQHIHTLQEPTCDSDYPSEIERSWRKPEDLWKAMPFASMKPSPVYFSIDGSVLNQGMNVGEGEFRFHCTAEGDGQ